MPHGACLMSDDHRPTPNTDWLTDEDPVVGQADMPGS